MKILKVEEMHCENCVRRISFSFEAEGLKFEINLEERTVSVEEDKVDLAIDLLDDLGFSTLV